MPHFYFQQFAGRTSKRGQNWLENVSVVPETWLKELTSALSLAGVVPNSGKDISCRGGVYIGGTQEIIALFSICSAPQDYKDYYGRTDGVVLNVLFCKTEILSAEKSLKNAWTNPAMSLPPQETALEQIFIQLDDNMGDSEEEKSFFTSISKHYEDEIIILYPNKGETPRFIGLSQKEPASNGSCRDCTNERSSKTINPKKQPYFMEFIMKNRFMLGMFTGIVLAVICFLYFKSEKSMEKTENLLTVPVNQLRKRGYQIPLIVNITEDKDGNQKVVISLSKEEITSRKGNKGDDWEKNGK